MSYRKENMGNVRGSVAAIDRIKLARARSSERNKKTTLRSYLT